MTFPDTTVFVRFVNGFLEYTVFICELLDFRNSVFTVSANLGYDAASTADWYTTFRNSVVVETSLTLRQIAEERRLHCLLPQTALSNSDN